MQRKANKNRESRVNEAIKEELSLILRDMKDPRIDLMTSIVRCDTSRDLKYCKVYYSVLGDETKKEEAKEALKAGTGYLRRELAIRLNLRQTPELSFIADDSMEYSQYLDGKFREIHEEDEEKLKNMTPEMREAKKAFEASLEEGDSEWNDGSSQDNFSDF